MSSRLRETRPLPRVWVEAWRNDVVATSQIRRAYSRFLQRRRPARTRDAVFRVTRWILLGVAVGVSSVYAATGPLRFFGGAERVADHRVPPPTPQAPKARALAPLTRPLATPRPSFQPQPSPPRSPSVVASSPPSPLAREGWQRAARGLRERDFETANEALVELARTGSIAERESAQLVQAQLLLSQGREAEAVTLLRRLQSSAGAPSVRQKSTELLTRVDETGSSRRSFASPEGTNSP